MTEAASGQGGTGAGAGASAPQENQQVMAEFAPFAEDATLPPADTDLIMNTLFGSGDSAQGEANSGGDQGGGNTGSQPSDGKPGAAAPAPGASGEGGGDAPRPQAAQGAGGREELAPFPGASPSPQQQEPQPAGAPQQSQSPGQGAPPSPSASAPAGEPQLPPEVKLELESLRAMVQQLQARAPQQPAASPGTQPGQQSGTGAGDQPQAIHLTTPPDVVAAIFNEDANISRQGIDHLASAIATVAMQHTLKAVEPLIDGKISGYAGAQQQQSESQRIEQDFYGAFPALKNELYMPLVASTYQEMQAALPGASWSEDFRNALGAKVQAKLASHGIQLPAGAVPPSPNNQQQQERGPVSAGPANGNGAAQPAATPMLGSGTRPAGAGASGDSNFIAQTLA